MTVVLLDGERIVGFDGVYDAFAAALAWPADGPRNLDALHDRLTESDRPVGVIVCNPAPLQKALGRRWDGFCRMLADLQGEREGLTVCLDPFGENPQKNAD
ncbi:MAG: barstar family protein [Acutalibacteraceae bacterium]|jgi:RNAse (barnase) inhibitor barstar